MFYLSAQVVVYLGANRSVVFCKFAVQLYIDYIEHVFYYVFIETDTNMFARVCRRAKTVRIVRAHKLYVIRIHRFRRRSEPVHGGALRDNEQFSISFVVMPFGEYSVIGVKFHAVLFKQFVLHETQIIEHAHASLKYEYIVLCVCCQVHGS